MNIVEIFISLGLLTVIYKYFEKKSFDVVMVKSNLNGKKYLVRNLPDKQEASDNLSYLSDNLGKIVDYLSNNNRTVIFNKFMKEDFDKQNNLTDKSSEEYKEKVQKNKTNLMIKLKRDIDRLKSNFNPENIYENTPNAKYTSYSVNKGEKLYFCLRSKKNDEKLVDKNIMMFVAIHELSHLMTEAVGHPPDFWNNFKFLLKVAIDLKVYNYIDFNAYPKDYCGTKITDTPL
jgi:predicted metal-dependent hydrolase